MAKPDKPRSNKKPVVTPTAMPTIQSPAKPKAKRKSPPAAKAPLSNEFVQDSDDDEGPSVTPVKVKEFVAKKKTPGKKAASKAAVVEVSSDSETSSEESDGSDSEASKGHGKITKGISKSESGSGSGSDSGDKNGEDSSDDENSESSSTSTPPPSKGKGLSSDSRPQQTAALTSHVSETRPAPPFQPPHSFKSVNTPFTTSKTTDLFPSQKTDGKQIWYITAPANVPITSLKELALDKLVEGEPVMSYKDVDYSFITDDTARPTTSLILPSKNGFKPLSTEVQKVVHLRQVVKLPTAPQSRAGIPSASTTILPQPSVQVRTKREQPKGLRMRYRPSGAGTGDIGSIGSPDSDEPTSSRPVITSSNAAVSKKRKERDENTVSGEKKKKKKDKHREGHAIENTTATAAKEGSKKSKDLPSGFSTINVAAKLNGHAESKKKDKEKKKKERDREKA